MVETKTTNLAPLAGTDYRQRDRRTEISVLGLPSFGFVKDIRIAHDRRL